MRGFWMFNVVVRCDLDKAAIRAKYYKSESDCRFVYFIERRLLCIASTHRIRLGLV